MRNIFINKAKPVFWQQVSLSLILLAVLLFILLIPSGLIDSWPYKRNRILIFSVAIAAFIQIFVKKDKFTFNKIDVLFLSFIAWNFISYFWATNPSLIWDKSFAWVFLYSFYKVVSSLDIRQLNLTPWLHILLLTLIFNNLALGWFYFDTSSQGDSFGFDYLNLFQLRNYLQFNPNYIGSLLAMTFPLYLLLWYYRQKWRWLILLLALLHLLLLAGLNCRGAVVAVILQLILLAIINAKKFRKLIWLFPIAFVLFIALNFFIKDNQAFYNAYNPLKGIQRGHDERLLIVGSVYKSLAGKHTARKRKWKLAYRISKIWTKVILWF